MTEYKKYYSANGRIYWTGEIVGAVVRGNSITLHDGRVINKDINHEYRDGNYVYGALFF